MVINQILWTAGATFGLYTALTGVKLPGQATAVAEGNALGKGALVYHLLPSALHTIQARAAGQHPSSPGCFLIIVVIIITKCGRGRAVHYIYMYMQRRNHRRLHPAVCMQPLACQECVLMMLQPPCTCTFATCHHNCPTQES